MKRTIGNYYMDELEQCTNKIKVNKKLKEMLNLDDKLSEEDEKEIINSILADEMGIELFINNLSHLRTRGKLEKSKKFIEFLGNALNKLISYERKHNDYEFIKSCLILSQTFYYLDLNIEKRFIFEYISDNNWLKSPNFWRNFIESMLEIEFNKAKAFKRIDLNDLIFAQLIPYIKNMQDFGIDERIIIKIIDDMLNKYDYIKK